MRRGEGRKSLTEMYQTKAFDFGRVFFIFSMHLITFEIALNPSRVPFCELPNLNGSHNGHPNLHLGLDRAPRPGPVFRAENRSWTRYVAPICETRLWKRTVAS